VACGLREAHANVHSHGYQASFGITEKYYIIRRNDPLTEADYQKAVAAVSCFKKVSAA